MVSVRCHAVRVRVPSPAPGAQKSTYEVISMPLVGPVRTGPGGLGHWGQRQGRVDDVAQQAMGSLAAAGRGGRHDGARPRPTRARGRGPARAPLGPRRLPVQRRPRLREAREGAPRRAGRRAGGGVARRRRADRGRRGLRARLPQHHHRRTAPCGASSGCAWPASGSGSTVPEQGSRVVIDYSAPNIAKEMHVGHLRTTIIGDSLARVLGHLGATVIRQNHLGDWGTQFGMLIQYLDEHPDARWRHSISCRRGRARRSTVSALDGLYRVARTEFDADPAFADRARARVVALQAGDEATLARWREIVDESELAFREIYGRLGVLLEPGDSAGESFYNQWLPEVVEELLAAGVATYSDGAVVVESEEVKAPTASPAVLMVQKRDGGYGYDTTDLATLRYRVRDLKADRILYVVDARQALHFRLIFEAARRMGWLDRGRRGRARRVRHRARAGRAAVQDPRGRHRAADAPDRRGRRLGPAHRRRARAGPPRGRAGPHRRAGRRRGGQVRGPVDLPGQGLHVRHRADGVATGNTSVYLQYAHARIRSILRKAGERRTPRRTRAADASRGTGARAGAGRVRGRPARRRRGERTAPAVQLPVRHGEGVHRLLRELPGAPSGVRERRAGPRTGLGLLCRLGAAATRCRRRRARSLLGVAARRTATC